MATKASETAFPQVDISKFFEQMKVPGLDMDKLVETQRKTVEAMIEAQQTTSEVYQGVIRRHVEMMQSSMEDMSAALNDVMKQESPSDAAAKQLSFVQKSLESNFANLRELAEMTSGAHSQAFKIMQDRFSESLAALKANGKS